MTLKNVARPFLLTVLVLWVPWIGMLFSDEILWTAFDFIAMGALIFGVSLLYEWLAQRRRTGSAGGTSRAYRLGVAIALTATLLLVWINGAVGFIGNENNPVNLLFGAVPVTLGMGALIARLRARGLERTLWLTAIVQTMVPVVAWIFWGSRHQDWSLGVLAIFVLNTLFAGLWVASALLFRMAGRVN